MTGVDRINGMMRTGAPAIAAADAFRAVRCLPDGNIQLAGVLTSTALGTFFRVDAETIQCDRVKEAVDRAERTQIAAERTVHHDAQHQQHDQDGYFPSKQPAQRRAQRRIGRNQRNARKECARRADVLTEPRLALSHNIQHGQRQNNDKADQNDVFQIFEHTITRQAAQFFGKRDFVQQILHQPERAQQPQTSLPNSAPNSNRKPIT